MTVEEFFSGGTDYPPIPERHHQAASMIFRSCVGALENHSSNEKAMENTLKSLALTNHDFDPKHIQKVIVVVDGKKIDVTCYHIIKVVADEIAEIKKGQTIGLPYRAKSPLNHFKPLAKFLLLDAGYTKLQIKRLIQDVLTDHELHYDLDKIARKITILKG